MPTETGIATILAPVIPYGTIWAFAGANAPTGWMLCDGTAISRTTYVDLFSIIGTTYGVGDGSTTFNLPDLKGRVIVGAGAGAGLTARSRGNKSGEEGHTLTTAEMPSHTHGIPYYQSGTSGDKALGDYQVAGYVASQGAGSDGAHNNMQPYTVVNYIIKV